MKEVLEKVLRLGAEKSKSLYDKNRVVRFKGDRDYAMEADMEMEEYIRELLVKETPGIPVFGEELGFKGTEHSDDEPYWVVDPIDGSVNYRRGIPLFGCAIALIQKRVSIAGGIVFPALDELYVAARGQGASCNGVPVRVSDISSAGESIIGFGDFAVKGEFKEKNAYRSGVLNTLGNTVLRVRMPGSAALQLAWVARGAADMSITFSNNSWDVQAGVILVREAGGMVFDRDGSDHTIDSGYTLATNGMLKDTLLELL
jgi:myo-inositol-1(or 4)-monophosphatase